MSAAVGRRSSSGAAKGMSHVEDDLQHVVLDFRQVCSIWYTDAFDVDNPLLLLALQAS